MDALLNRLTIQLKKQRNNIQTMQAAVLTENEERAMSAGGRKKHQKSW